MGKSLSLLLCLLALLPTASCGRREERPREDAFLAVENPVKISELTFPGLVRTSRGSLILTLFIHSAFPSATEARDAVSVLESDDGGAPWREISRVPSYVTYGVWGYDVANDGHDNIYLTWVAALRKSDTAESFKAIMFSRSDDGGRSWTGPVRVSDATSGQRRNPVVAVSGDNVYIAWLDEEPRGAGARGRGVRGDVYCVCSADRGATWSANACLEKDLDKKDAASGEPSLCIGADGTVYCVYFSMRQYERVKGGFWVAKSTDRGKSFVTSFQDVGPLGVLCIAETDGQLCLATVYIRGIKSISMQNPQTSHEIRLYVSSDGGARWSKPVLVDDDQQHNQKNNLRLLCLGPKRLAACWDDGRGGLYMAASMDAGRSWGKNLKVAERSHVGSTVFDVAADRSSGVFYLSTSDIREGADDATYLVKGKVVSR
jgi:hypothetical protein